MTRSVVYVVQTGTANSASVLAGLRRAGSRPLLTNDPDRVRVADRVVLPGVGTLAAAMHRLQTTGLAPALAERVRSCKPTLAVCLGLQLLAEGSEESPGTRALSVIPGVAKRFPDSVRVPQLGWNRIEPARGCKLLTPGYAYFANSYRLSNPPLDWSVAYADHGGTFVAGLEKGGLLACQFHPELSGVFGQNLIQKWLETTRPGGC
jgi:imidazole glycerol-phosphate synthase subunit HisH